MPTKSPQERAETLVRYLEEKCNIGSEVPNTLRPSTLKAEIQEIFEISESAVGQESKK